MTTLKYGYPLTFTPIAQERIWGGSLLPRLFNIEHEGKIGEIWTLSDHPSQPSMCTNGPLAGQSFSEIVQAYPQLYIGDSWATATKQARFPLLVKFLHANDDLSVQIHPDDSYALEHEHDYGKTEAWYILDAQPDARINYGHHFSSKEEYYQAIRDQNVKDHLRFLPVQKGDFIYVPARTLHALLKGTVVVEIQQTSDVTYRVYDWDRLDRSGQSRQLHIDQAADVMLYADQQENQTPAPTLIYQDADCEHLQLLQCPYFTIEKVSLTSSLTNSFIYSFDQNKKRNPEVLIVLEGEGELLYNSPSNPGRPKQESLLLKQGQTILLPTDLDQYKVTGKLSFLRTFY